MIIYMFSFFLPISTSLKSSPPLSSIKWDGLPVLQNKSWSAFSTYHMDWSNSSSKYTSLPINCMYVGINGYQLLKGSIRKKKSRLTSNNGKKMVTIKLLNNHTEGLTLHLYSNADALNQWTRSKTHSSVKCENPPHMWPSPLQLLPSSC